MAYNPNNPNGQATSANSAPVVIASDQSSIPTNMPDTDVTGAATQTATVNNILTVASGASATDVSGYRSASVQVNSSGTAGTYIFEGSNDNSTFIAIPVFNQLILTGTPITASVTASATQIIYSFPINFRYVRLRIATTITGGSIQAISRFTQAAWTSAVVQVAQSAGANLNTVVTTLPTLASVTTVSTVSALSAVNSVATTNGLTLGTQISPTTPAALNIKASAGRILFLHIGNPNASSVFVKLFNATTVTLGTTTATMNFLIPQATSINVSINDIGLFFSTGIQLAITGGASLTDNTAITTGCEVNYSFI